jgi:hypothetical protein
MKSPADPPVDALPSAEQQRQQLAARAARGSRGEFDAVLAKVPDVEPAAEDRW